MSKTTSASASTNVLGCLVYHQHRTCLFHFANTSCQNGTSLPLKHDIRVRGEAEDEPLNLPVP
jgi:hypothetical protein